mgnify:CR=1 FL=1
MSLQVEKEFDDMISKLVKRRSSMEVQIPFYEFMDKAKMFISWLEARVVIVSAIAPKDAEDLEVLIRKHRCIDLEISSNTSYFKDLLNSGEQLQETKKDSTLTEVLSKLKTLWEEITTKTKNKMLELDQTTTYKLFCSEVNLVKHQFNKAKPVVETLIDQVPFDELKNHHKELKQCNSNLIFVEDKMKELDSISEKIVSNSHSASGDVKRELDEVKRTFGELKVRMK